VGDQLIRAAAERYPVPTFDSTPFVQPPPLAAARVAIVTTAALHAPDQPPIYGGDHSFRVLESVDELVLGQGSPNFDRSGWLLDPNVVLPVDRLRELAAAGVIGSVAPRQLAFAGNQPDETLATIGLDSGPAAARLLRADGVDVVLLTPV
jgi:D-proline reductase (dithiol) PrdB